MRNDMAFYPFFGYFLAYILIFKKVDGVSNCDYGKVLEKHGIAQKHSAFLKCLTLNVTRSKGVEALCRDLCCKTTNCNVALLPKSREYNINCCLIQCDPCRFKESHNFNSIKVKRMNGVSSNAVKKSSAAVTTSSEKKSTTQVSPKSKQHKNRNGKSSTDTDHEKSTTNKQSFITKTPKEPFESTSIKPSTTTKHERVKVTTSIMRTTTLPSTTKPLTTTLKASTSKTPLTKTSSNVRNVDDVRQYRTRDMTTTAALVTALCFGVIFLSAVTVLCGKRTYEAWKRRHYTQVDYLINGMYN